VSARRAVAGRGRDPVHLTAKVRLPHVPSLQRPGGSHIRTCALKWPGSRPNSHSLASLASGAGMTVRLQDRSGAHQQGCADLGSTWIRIALGCRSTRHPRSRGAVETIRDLRQVPARYRGTGRRDRHAAAADRRRVCRVPINLRPRSCLARMHSRHFV